MGCATSSEDSVITCQINKQERAEILKSKQEYIKDKTDELKRKRKKQEHRRDLSQKRRVANLEGDDHSKGNDLAGDKDQKVYSTDEVKMLLALEKGMLKPMNKSVASNRRRRVHLKGQDRARMTRTLRWEIRVKLPRLS